MLGLRGPFGTGWDLDAAVGGDLVVIGGGIGLAPVRSAVRAAIAERDRFGRIAVLVGARSPDLLLYEDDLEAWRRRGDVEVLVTVDAAPSGVDRGRRRGHRPRRPGRARSLERRGARVRARGHDALHRGRAPSPGASPRNAIQVSLERNMACAIAHCGHCQLGPVFVCREGPVFDWSTARSLLEVRAR